MTFIIKPTALASVWASTGVKLEPEPAKVAAGWVVENPPYQYDNWLNNRQDTFIAHVNQCGVPHWDDKTEYIGAKSYVQGSNGIIYKALVTNTNIAPTNPLNASTWVKAFEDFGTIAAVQAQLNAQIIAYGTLEGLTNTVTARANLAVFSKTETDVRFAPVAGNLAQTFTVANATAPSHAINKGQFDTIIVPATESVSGISRIASQTDLNVGVDDTRFVTSLKGTTTFNRRDKNLSDISNVAAARSNLGLTSTAITPQTEICLKVDNLLGLANVATARSNLGLGTLAVANAIDYLTKAGNFAGLADVTVARANLGLGTAALATLSDLTLRASNLSDLTNIVAARANLGLGTMAVLNGIDFLAKGSNLSDVPNKATARANLGLGTMAVESTGDYLTKSGNLVGIASPAVARSSLQLGTISTSNLFVSTAAPTAGVGVVGDIWFQY